MKKTLSWAVTAAFLAGAAPAQEADIQSTISSQIEAFLADDFGQAFTYASPNIQGLFGSPERFGSMVQQGYPMVWRPDDVRYLELRERGGSLWQKVQITDQGGGLHILDYQMIETENGWKINGVQLLPSPDVSA